VAALDAGSDGKWRRAVADSPDLAENGSPGSVSRAGSTGRMRALRGTHLGARVGGMGAGRGARWWRPAVELRRGIARAGRRRKKGEKGAGDAPYHNAELRGHLLDGGKWRSGGRLWCGGGGLARLGFCEARRRLQG
jgi:hypothetical protein